MASCPNGHTSQSADYCDVCGERIGGATAGGAGSPAPPAAQQPPAHPPGGTPCPDCGTPGADRFCEMCGYDFATGGGRPTPRTAPAQQVPPVQPTASAPGPPVPPAASPALRGPSEPPPAPRPPDLPAPPTAGAVWTAVVTADREYFSAVIAEAGPDSASLSFPPYAPERRIPMTGSQIRIGRRSSSQPSPPEIDLREPPEDPGVSHVHAVLLAKPDGTWTLVDPGSTNRTCMNGSMDPIPYNVEVPVSEGDRIHVGAWTTITLTRGEAI